MSYTVVFSRSEHEFWLYLSWSLFPQLAFFRPVKLHVRAKTIEDFRKTALKAGDYL
jgi:hypothetical protein